MRVLACDIGFGYVKFLEAEAENGKAFIKTKGRFPSAVKRLLFSDGFGLDEHPDFVVRDGKAYLVGESAACNEKGLRVRTSTFMLENLPLFLERVFRELEKAPDILILGTPLQEWRRLKEEIVKAGKSFAGQCECYPQAAATVVLNRSALQSRALIVDVGYNTTDVVPVDRGRPLVDDGVSWERSGISAVQEEVAAGVRNLLGISLTEADLDAVLINPNRLLRCFPDPDKKICTGLKEMVDRALLSHAEWLHAKITDRFGDHPDRKTMLVGGGARLLAKHFKRLFQSRVITASEPEFANVKGFCLLGLARAGFKGKVSWKLQSPEPEPDIKESVSKEESETVEAKESEK